MIKYVLAALCALNLQAEAKVSRKPAQALSEATIKSVFNKLDDQCAGNDNGGIGQFDVEKFKPGVAKRQLRKDNDGCKGMKMSKSKEEGAQAFVNYLTKKSKNKWDEFHSCVKENLTATEIEQIVTVAQDPENLGVFSSQFDDKDESEACSFHHFVIYRANGQKIYVVHDETD